MGQGTTRGAGTAGRRRVAGHPGHLVRVATSPRAMPKAAAAQLYCFPVRNYPKGKIPWHWSSPAAVGSPKAADLFAPRGTIVQAMVAGKVTQAGWDATGGWYVIMQGDSATKSLWYYQAHLHARPTVVAGDRVICGQVLGNVGNSGNASKTEPHLHIGIGLDILDGSGPEGGAGVPWPGNDCNRYLQYILDTIGSGPVGPPTTPDAPPAGDVAQLRRQVEELQRELAEAKARRDWLESVRGYLSGDLGELAERLATELKRHRTA